MIRAQLDNYIMQIIQFNPKISDIIFTVGKRAQVELDGELVEINLNPDPGKLRPWHLEQIVNCILNRNLRLYMDLVKTGSCDLSYYIKDRAKFRVNVFSQRSSLAVVMRKLALYPPTIDELRLPDIFKKMAYENFGLILVTGATGTGKSTSLAALINEINSTQSKHIVTLEDPIEYIHYHKKGTVNQRELGKDFDTFSSGLRAALRQAPKVILVGEIRDRETLSIALEASETGHLVLGTLHTSDAGHTINRIIGMFDLKDERMIRGRLAESLKFVISQRLLPKIGGGRVAAFEILVNNIRIRELILKGEDEERTFYKVIETGEAFGMVTFDKYIASLFKEGVITERTAMLYSTDKAKLGQMIDKIKAQRGEKVTDIEGLELDFDYEKKILS